MPDERETAKEIGDRALGLRVGCAAAECGGGVGGGRVGIWPGPVLPPAGGGLETPGTESHVGDGDQPTEIEREGD